MVLCKHIKSICMYIVFRNELGLIGILSYTPLTLTIQKQWNSHGYCGWLVTEYYIIFTGSYFCDFIKLSQAGYFYYVKLAIIAGVL